MKTLTLHVPASPDDVVQSDLVLPSQPDPFEAIPFGRCQLLSGTNSNAHTSYSRCDIKLRPLSLQKGRMARMVAFARIYRSTLDTRNCTVHRERKRVFFYYVRRNGKRCKSVNQRPITARRCRAFSLRVSITHSMKHVSLSFCLENISISRIRQP